MDNQIQKYDQNLVTLLAGGITKEGNVDIAPVDKIGIGIEMRKYKNERGLVDYGKLLTIPKENRIPSLAQKDMRGTVTMISVAITLAMESLNLKRKMSAPQIVDLAEAIIDDAAVDQIGIEDIILFLQRLTKGEYGELYESLDAVKFMHHFNKYRDEKWEECIKIRDTKNEEYKQEGGAREARKLSQFDNILQGYATKLQAKNDEIKSLREERKRRHGQDNF